MRLELVCITKTYKVRLALIFLMSFFTDNHVVFFELLDGSVGDYVSSAENVAEFVAAVHFKS